MKKNFDRVTLYNRAVSRELEAISPEAQHRLSSRGEVLGWWNNIRYWLSIGWTPQQSANRLKILHDESI